MFARCRCLLEVICFGAIAALANTGSGQTIYNVFNMPAGDTSLQFVNVGDPGNTADTATMNGQLNINNSPDNSTGYGGVSYSYAMGTYDVTVGQYVQFLNAVAKSDPYGLYYIGMLTGAGQTLGGYPVACGIKQSGTSGNYTYSIASTADGFPTFAANLPLNWDSWGSAARFINWLENGQPIGAEGPGTTETGTYALNGGTSTAALFAVPTPTPGTVKYWIPTENEWYKAAYYKGGGLASGYWSFPTQSNSGPSNTLSTTGTNNANWNSSGLASPNNWPLTPVGYYAGSPSHYGTFDQGGDLYNFTETKVTQTSDTTGEGLLVYVMRGGSFHPTGTQEMQSNWRYGAGPGIVTHGRTFRVAMTFSTAQWSGLGDGNWSSMTNWSGDACRRFCGGTLRPVRRAERRQRREQQRLHRQHRVQRHHLHLRGPLLQPARQRHQLGRASSRIRAATAKPSASA